GLGVRGRLPDLPVEEAVRGRPAGERGQLRAAYVPQDVDEEEPVLRGHVADRVHGVRARGAPDVRDPVAIPHDGPVPAAGVVRLAIAGEGRAEAGIFVVASRVLGA